MSIFNFRKNLSGVHAGHHKNSKDVETEEIPTPKLLKIPMLQHMGAPCVPVVKKGDTVLAGQVIGESSEYMSVPIHASCSGTVADVADYHTVSGALCKCVVIETDGSEQKMIDTCVPEVKNREDFISHIKKSGLVGLGGAGFPTFAKLDYKDIEKVDKLVINAAECEPYITTDFRECIENTDDIVDGIEMVCKYLNIKQVYIGIEANKPEAIEKLTKVFADNSNITVVKLKTIYPQGAEKSIIYAATGIVVGEGKLPADCGVIVMNVSTVGFIGRYFKTGVPLISKRITVDGDMVTDPKNLEVPIGVPIEYVLEYCGITKDYAKVLMGGPMMGLTVMSNDMPIIKNNNAITLLSEKASLPAETTACIRCGKCIGVCPMDLMPAKLERAYDTQNIEMLNELHLFLCINCGCCTYICPAKRHLAQKNQTAKLLVRNSK